MFRFRVQDAPTNYTSPYTIQFNTIREGIEWVRGDSKIQLIHITDQDGAVHYGGIKENGELVHEVWTHRFGYNWKHHESEAYKKANEIKVAKLA